MSEELVPITLVPVEVFGGHCECHEKHAEDTDCAGWGYGLSDAVSSWSDCNRADGRIYRVDDTDPKCRTAGETIVVYVPRGIVPWFEKHWGEGAQERAEVEAAQEQVVAEMLGRPPVDTVSVRVLPPETTVADELALAIGAALASDISPNSIASALVRSGWTNPRLPYLKDMEATR